MTQKRRNRMFLYQSSLKVIFFNRHEIYHWWCLDHLIRCKRGNDRSSSFIFEWWITIWLLKNDWRRRVLIERIDSVSWLEQVSFSVSEQPASWRPRTALTVPGHGSASGRVVVKMVYFIALQNQTKMVNKWVNLPFADGLRFSCDWTIPFSESRGAAKIKLNTLF